jgi:hypothetical protein
MLSHLNDELAGSKANDEAVATVDEWRRCRCEFDTCPLRDETVLEGNDVRIRH